MAGPDVGQGNGQGNGQDMGQDVAQQHQTARIIDHAAERALCRKLDLHILPLLAVMYLFNALDKGNLANAQTQGLGKDLGFHEGQYNLVVSVFFVPFVVLAPPLAMVAKAAGPWRALPTMMAVFGTATLVSAAARSLASLLALRCVLGGAEAAFFPVVVFYLTTFYRRAELARRLAIFYAASNMAGAFSGLLAFAVFRIPTTPVMDHPWRYLFLIEGAATVLAAGVAGWCLPRCAAQAHFLSNEERQLAYWRVQLDSSSVVSERKLDVREALRVFGHPTSLVFVCIDMCLGVPLQSVALFLPQIIQRLGYGVVKTNLYTVAPYVSGAVVLLALAFLSDATRLRSPFIVVAFTLTLLGFAIYAAIDRVEEQLQLAYFATFMMCWGSTAPSVLLSTWYSNNVAHEGRRLALTSVGVPLANVMGLVAGNVFRQADAPKYKPALMTAAMFGVAGAVLTAALASYMAWDNARRNRDMGVVVDARDVPTQRLREGPGVAEFRWFL
ncbi:hypothetical protein CDD82_7046 [Ophiocordyceps australis]|uniref:Major facilitator superfamily (MFS) profile domain-containing protein n=1 Tax=Ophiocordyceps australis TaxID=1399860 RepID=A0A2C5XFI0_9HYPO|nr:hypothetical protein CDD82_7046 [Ophiocordyceps australis]